MNLFSPAHLILILVIVVLLFGGKKIPEILKGLGQGIKEFKKAKDEVETDDKDEKKLPKKDA